MEPAAITDGVVSLPRTKFVKGTDSARKTNVNELPGAVLTTIFCLVSDTRTRNRMSLACRDWYYLERQTRTSLTLRGNLCNLLQLPITFRSITSLDLSFCSPWGYSLFQTTADGESIGQALQDSFPNIKDLAIYVRDGTDVRMVAWLWPQVEAIRLVRWHQRSEDNLPGMENASEVEPLLGCHKLRKLDLSEFYCWTEDILPALISGAATASNLRVLNLLKLSPEGFKTREIADITALCSNLEEFFIICEFDPRFLDSVGDVALDYIASHCPRMRVLHLVDTYEWGAAGTGRSDGAGAEDANVSSRGLEIMAMKLPHLQSLTLLLGQNVWDSHQGLEALFTHCRNLSSLQLSHFHGLCSGSEDGLATGTNLTELSIKRSVDLSDRCLASIGRGCKKLRKLSLKCCSGISEQGVNTCVRALSETLVDVEIFGCMLLPSVETLRAVEPIRNSIQRLHLDCIWDEAVVARQAAAVAAGECASMTKTVDITDDEFVTAEMAKRGFSFNFWQTSANSSTALHLGVVEGSDLYSRGDLGSTSQAMRQSESTIPRVKLIVTDGKKDMNVGHRLRKDSEASGSCGDTMSPSLAYNTDEGDPAVGVSSDTAAGGDNCRDEEAPDQRCWKSLQKLSLWMDVGFLMSPLPSMGLGQCPVLTEVTIKVEGDCKALERPTVRDWGLATLSRYEMLSKLNLDLAEVVSYSLSAPEGQVDLSIWERHYLSGIAELKLHDLDYKPPCDRDLNHRGLSLPAVGHFSQCPFIRRFIVHGSAHEHFLSMLQRNATLRDFQLRWDFYPAPEYETSNEVRVEACRRFEEALIERGFPD